MREILFRGKQSNSDAWVNGIYCPYTWDFFGTRVETPQIIIISDDNDDGKWTDVIPETVGQYTGLTDKNDARIFEGDVVRHLTDYHDMLVTYDEFIGCWLFEDIDDDMQSYGFAEFDFDDIEIIGNKYDNPNLLDKLKGVT